MPCRIEPTNVFVEAVGEIMEQIFLEDSVLTITEYNKRLLAYKTDFTREQIYYTPEIDSDCCL
jgi:hypothetical protein